MRQLLKLLLFLCALLLVAVCVLAQQNPQVVLSDPLLRGAVSWWRPLLGFTGGDRLFDLLPAQNHLTLTNMSLGSTSGWSPTTRPGGVAQINCDGTDDYLSIPNNSSFNLSAGSLVVWAMRTSTAAEMIIVSMSDGGLCCNNLLALEWKNNTSDTLRILITSGGVDQLVVSTTSTTIAPANVWHHLAFTVDSSGNALYVDGVQAAMTYGTGTASTTAFFSTIYSAATTFDVCRMNTTDAPAYLTGAIAQLTLYNRALTAGEVLALYQRSQGLPPMGLRTDDLVASPTFPTGTLLPFFP